MSHADEQVEQVRQVLDGHASVREMNWAVPPAEAAAKRALASHLTAEAAWREHVYRCRYRAHLAEFRTTALQQLLNLALDGGDETMRKACVDLIRAAQAELAQPLTTPEPLTTAGGEDDHEQARSFLHWFLTVTHVEESAAGGEP